MVHLAALALLANVPTMASGADKLIIVVIDGLRATEGLDDPTYQYIPHIGNVIAPLGTVARVCDNMGMTLTVAGHACVGSGRYQYLPDDGSVRPFLPHIWEYYRAQTGAGPEETLVIATKAKLGVLAYSQDWQYGAADSARTLAGFVDDGDAIDQLVYEMAVKSPKIIFLNLGDVDVGGHVGDWGYYTQTILRADELIHYLWTRIQLFPEYRNKTDLIITGDHGRHTDDYHGHGDTCAGCRRIPFVAVGPDFKVGETSWTPCEQDDICKTVGVAMGIETPKAGGRVLTEILNQPTAALDASWLTSRSIVRMRDGAAEAQNGFGGPAQITFYDVAGRWLFGSEIPDGGSVRYVPPSTGVLFYVLRQNELVQTGKLVHTR